MKNFAIIGVGGYIAPRHLKAISDTGNRLVAAVDPKDSVGVLDRFSFDTKFFTEFERFDRHLEKLRRGSAEDQIQYVSICSPNYLHDAHCRQALRIGADAICEKPLVINPWNLDALQELEQEYNRKVYTVLQLRVHPMLIALRDQLLQSGSNEKHDVTLTYITGRGPWYFDSWKGMPEKSGGIAVNIGIHFFDLLLWLFGNPVNNRLYVSSADRMSGYLELERARVKWFLSINKDDLPFPAVPGQKSTFRSITVDGKEVEFSEGFTDLHTRVYSEILAGGGFGIQDARPSIELVYQIRHLDVIKPDENAHPRAIP